MDPIDYYNQYAAKVFEDTVDQDMGAIMAPFLELLEEGDTILDMGCGSGRDSLTFYDLGYDVTQLAGSEEMCRLAEVHTGLDVLQMTYEEMAFDGAFDGVWACGAFVHIPKDEMPEIFRRVARARTEDGIFYLSKRLGDVEGFQGKRYFSCYSEKELRHLVEGDGLFTVLKEWVTRDVRSGHSDIQWINILARKK